MSYDIKQVIVFRGDLQVRKGKFAAQVAHASLKVFLDRAGCTTGGHFTNKHWYFGPHLNVPLTADMETWITGSFAKIVLLCPGLDELDGIARAAADAGLPCALVVDSGLTEFHGVPTPTCVAVGPAKSDEIDKITGSEGPFRCRLA